MGADIHMFAEVRLADGTWAKVGDVFDNQYYDPKRETKTFEDGYVMNAPKTDEPYQSRNYRLFAILGDVRNGYGFAGIITHKPIKPFFAKRGIPTDASQEYIEEITGWDADAHSASYATLAELKAAPWDSIGLEQIGFLDTREYERIRETDLFPEQWCGSVDGPFVQKITPAVYEREYRNVIEDKAANDDEMMSIYIYWRWFEPLTHAISEFLEGTIPALEKLGNPDDVRIVFFFDN
jgi:hypothetical protein